MTKRTGTTHLTTRDYLETLLFAAVLIAGLPASIFIGMAWAG